MNPNTALLDSPVCSTGRDSQLSSSEVTFPTDTPVMIDGEQYLLIRDVDQMPAFLMSIASDSDFWLFVGSNGGFTAGRVDPDHAIFPYQTADKILSQPRASGVLSLLLTEGMTWEPWNGVCPPQGITRNLYKHVTGTSIIFEESHQQLALTFRWELKISEKFGLVRKCRLENHSDRPRSIKLLDGFHHLLPSGVLQETYARYSYLAAAYMRHEAIPDCGLGIYTLNSGITDRAEPCESLRVSCAWSVGLDQADLLLSDRQVDAFRRGAPITAESEARGEFGAHLLAIDITLGARKSSEWLIAADIGLDHTEVARLQDQLRKPATLQASVDTDLADSLLALKKRIAGAGAIQQSADSGVGIHHFANILFNCMRGGTLHDNYRFPRSDFHQFLQIRNREVSSKHQDWIATLPDPCSLDELGTLAAARGDAQLSRLAGEYLPICFSRRHGDPSRPWNRFEIHTKDAAGQPLFAYAGNWRDIFQNWESLAYNYPSCFRSMIAIFLNASTADGYNPYRITRAGIDWEVFDAADPWSHIGYWGDHQIIYLLRLLEGQEHFQPGELTSRLNERCHTYAHVPYEIGGFDKILQDPKHSIAFNEELHAELMERTRTLGGDGKLLADKDGNIKLVSLAEKLLVPLLVKLSNLVPGGGIWLNTQRPEWNDANNALAGWGLSVVTVAYVRRYLVFLEDVFDERAASEFSLSQPVADLLSKLAEILPLAAGSNLDQSSRFHIIEALGRAGETHRQAVYSRQSSQFTNIARRTLRNFITTALTAIDATLEANRRDDALFDSYNLLEIQGNEAYVRKLDLMLEGQVAALSSGILSPAEALRLLAAMRKSALYREDQNSYLLYPDRIIPSFLERNTLPVGWEKTIPQIAGNPEIIRVNDHGRAHFHPDLTNHRDLITKLDLLGVTENRDQILEIWENVFHHQAFTGRSGAMFAFEGLGSIYWHMVAKLLLAVQEIHLKASREDPTGADTLLLARAYDDVRNGLGFTKSSAVYGAFPTDPYSHSPRHRGAQQPGMTGQVKEEILTRMGELGFQVESGCVRLAPTLLKRSEFFSGSHTFSWIDIHGQEQSRTLGPNSLAFTQFQVPICYQLGGSPQITLEYSDGETVTIHDNLIPLAESRQLFEREGRICFISVITPATGL